MRSSNFLTLFLAIFFLLISSSNSQNSTGAGINIKMQTEIIKLNKKFSWLTDQLDMLKGQTTSVWSNQTELESQLSLVLDQCNQRNDDLQQEIDILKERIGELEANDEAWNNSITLTKPYIYSRYFDEFYTRTPTFIWNITDINTHILQQTNFTTVFNLTGQAFRAQAQAVIKSDVTLSLAYVKLGNESTELDLKLIPAVYYSCLDQRANDTIVMKKNYEFGTVFEHDEFNYVTQLIEASKIVNDSLAVSIYVEPPLVSRQGYSYDGSLTWAVGEYEEKRLAEQNNLVRYQQSPYFYTNATGFRMQAQLRLNGYGEFTKKGLTVTILFMTGPYDDRLVKAFRHNATVTLLHPSDPAKHIAKNVTEDLKDDYLYSIDMATHSEIQGLLDENTLYYQIQIVPA